MYTIKELEELVVYLETRLENDRMTPARRDQTQESLTQATFMLEESKRRRLYFTLGCLALAVVWVLAAWVWL